MLKKIVLLLATLLMVTGLHVQGADQTNWSQTGDSIIVQYNLVRYNGVTGTMYYLVHNSFSCDQLLDVRALTISNASGFAFVAGNMQYGKFGFYDDTCVVERKAFLFDTEKLKKILESDEDLIVTSYGNGKAVHFRIPKSIREQMLKLFKDIPLDIGSTL